MATKKPEAKAKKPDPKVLGTGMAGKAGKAISGRQKQLQDQMKKLGI
jgi:hypothetical protein